MRVERCVCCEQVHCRPKCCFPHSLGIYSCLQLACALQKGRLLALGVESRAHRDVA